MCLTQRKRQDGKERRQVGGSVQGGKSQGHRGAGADEEEREEGAGEGGEGERSEADAHIGKSTDLMTFCSNKAKHRQHTEI